MSLLNPTHLSSVAHITVQSPDQSRTSTGTAFCFVDRIPEKDTGYIYVVTCAHLFHEMPPSAHSTVRFNTRSGLRNMIASRQDWMENSSADVAVLQLNAEFIRKQNIDVVAWGFDDIVTRENATPKGVFEGEEVFILGYPIGWRPATLDYPIVRAGMIGQIRGWIDGHHSSILVSGTVFGGNSGSPVILRPQPGGLEGTPVLTKLHVLGMVASYHMVSSPASPVTGENAGIMDIVPMDTIYSLIKKHTGSDTGPRWTIKETTYAVTSSAAGPNCQIMVPTQQNTENDS